MWRGGKKVIVIIIELVLRLKARIIFLGRRTTPRPVGSGTYGRKKGVV
jgi:hypothetical protein